MAKRAKVKVKADQTMSIIIGTVPKVPSVSREVVRRLISYGIWEPNVTPCAETDSDTRDSPSASYSQVTPAQQSAGLTSQHPNV